MGNCFNGATVWELPPCHLEIGAPFSQGVSVVDETPIESKESQRETQSIRNCTTKEEAQDDAESLIQAMPELETQKETPKAVEASFTKEALKIVEGFCSASQSIYQTRFSPCKLAIHSVPLRFGSASGGVA